MSLALPGIVAAYFTAANGHDAERLATCFGTSATVRDEGKVHQGHAAIAAWGRASSAQYQAVMTPVALRGDATRPVVACDVSGNFPGSPVVLNFAFTLAAGRIDTLEITA